MSTGYYWYVHPSASREKIAAAGRDMTRLVEASPVPLKSAMNPDDPPIQPDGGIHFADQRGIEAFYWPPRFVDRPDLIIEGDWLGEWLIESSETRRRDGPFTAVVTACLLVAKRHLGDQIILDNGEVDDIPNLSQSDWAQGASYLQQVLGIEPPVPATQAELQKMDDLAEY